MQNKYLGLWIGCLAASLLAASCATAPKGEAKRSELIRRAASTVERFKEVDPSINKKFFTSAHGVAVFTLAAKGLMYEASVGGQKFSFESR
jgi:hypothetical protein